MSTSTTYVYVNADATVRELTAKEIETLEAPTAGPFDGGRPYIKESYKSKDGWGSVQGFCLRSAIPGSITIREATPANDAAKDMCCAKGCNAPRNCFSPFCDLHLQQQAETLRKPWWKFW